jgi:hypothetical protein
MLSFLWKQARALYLLGRCSTTEPCLQPLKYFKYFFQLAFRVSPSMLFLPHQFLFLLTSSDSLCWAFLFLVQILVFFSIYANVLDSLMIFNTIYNLLVPKFISPAQIIHLNSKFIHPNVSTWVFNGISNLVGVNLRIWLSCSVLPSFFPSHL